jgi:hypothetical protein
MDSAGTGLAVQARRMAGLETWPEALNVQGLASASGGELKLASAAELSEEQLTSLGHSLIFLTTDR